MRASFQPIPIQSQKILIWCSTENLENLEMERLAKQKEVNLSLH